MNEQPEHDFPFYRSPSSIRNEVFSHRMRGLDEEEVREYLDMLADQVEASDRERQESLAENERLRADNEDLRSQNENLRTATAESAEDEISPQAVALFSQAQQVADQLVEEAVLHARDLMSSARHQQREILEEARRAAETVAGEVARVGGPEGMTSVAGTLPEYSTPVPEIEYVRTFARVAQVQLRSVIDALAEQVDKLGDVPEAGPGGRGGRAQGSTLALGEQSRWIDLLPSNRSE